MHIKRLVEAPVGVGSTYSGAVKVADKVFHWNLETTESNLVKLKLLLLSED